MTATSITTNYIYELTSKTVTIGIPTGSHTMTKITLPIDPSVFWTLIDGINKVSFLPAVFLIKDKIVCKVESKAEIHKKLTTRGKSQ
jgi:hypothetical protein